MKYLYYKNAFYKELNDDDAQKIMNICTGRNRPPHIQLDDEMLKTAFIEIRNYHEKESNISFNKENWDIRNPSDMEQIEQFGSEINEWFVEQPEAERTFRHYLRDRGAVFLRGNPVMIGGKEFWHPHQIFIRNPALHSELSRKWNAWNDLGARKEYGSFKRDEQYDEMINGRGEHAIRFQEAAQKHWEKLEERRNKL